MMTYKEEEEEPYAFLILALDGVSGECHFPAALPWGKSLW
jgi:hypothetical protein